MFASMTEVSFDMLKGFPKDFCKNVETLGNIRSFDLILHEKTCERCFTMFKYIRMSAVPTCCDPNDELRC